MQDRVGIYVHPHTFAGALVGRHVASQSLVEALVAEGVDVSIFSELSAENVPWRGVRVQPLQALLTAEVDVLHCLDLGQWSGLVELRDHIGKPVPVTSCVHSLASPGVFPRLRDPMLSARDGVFCPTRAAADVLARVNIAMDRPVSFHTFVCPYPVYLPASGVVMHDLGSRLRETRDDLVITTIGRFSPVDKQDLGLLRRAVDVVRQRHPYRAITFVMAGAAQGREYEVESSRGGGPRNVIIVDFPDALKADLLRLSDIYVTTAASVQESYGIAVIEAMQAGLPIVATAFSGHRETVPNTAGILVPVAVQRGDDPGPVAHLFSQEAFHVETSARVRPVFDALVEALDALVSDSERRKTLGAGAQKHAQRFSPAQTVPLYIEAWRQLRAVTTPVRRPPDFRVMDLFSPFWTWT